MSNYTRRDLLKFLGRSSLVGLTTVSGLTFLNGCTQKKIHKTVLNNIPPLPFTALTPSDADDLLLAEGFNYEMLVKWDDAISDKDTFGFNNDYTAFIPFDPDNPDDGLLWVNHEYTSPMFVSGYTGEADYVRTKEAVDKEQYSVGGSIVRIKRNSKGTWQVVYNDPHNRRITAQTPIPFNWPEPIRGSKQGIGTLGNCSGGITPWGTILTCEENYDAFWGETDYSDPENPTHVRSVLGWEDFYDNPPEHYGWVVEVDPKTGEAQKHIALGRCAHECATMYQMPDGRLVVYTGDDANDQCLYKFVSAKPKSLVEGTLYVANTMDGKWISLNMEEQPILKENFANQTEVLIRLREAAALVGGTPLNRPEDIEIDPLTGNILISLTNNKPKGDIHGSILKIVEKDQDKTALEFTASTFLAGGPETGFSCPDNMAFDVNGNLWFTSDISGSSMNAAPYAEFKNNGLFVVVAGGPDAGKVVQIASAPTHAELTGPFFSPDGKTLFLSIQHPGEGSSSLTDLASNWPDGGNNIPRPSVVAVSGPSLEFLAS